MKRLAIFLSTLVLASRRLWNHWLLMLCLLAGLTAASGLLSSIPLYADAVQHRLLQGELTEAGTYRPPFAFLWRYIGAWYGDVSWEAYTPADEHLSQQAPNILGLPLDRLVRHVQTGKLNLFAIVAPGQAESTGRFTSQDPLLLTSVGFISNLQDHIELLEGAFPKAGEAGQDTEILISQVLAEQAGLQVGERYLLLGTGSEPAQIPVRIAGVWRPRNPAEPFWFYQPGAFDEVLLTSEPAFAAQVAPVLAKPVSLAVWYPIFDGRRVRAGDVPDLLRRVSVIEARTTALLNNTTLDASPVAALQSYSRAARLLTVLLTIFSLPVMGIVIYFIEQMGDIVVRRDQPEIAVLRSRGMTRAQVLLIYLLEGLLIGGMGLIVGLPLGRWLAQLMSQTRTFLDSEILSSGDQTPLPVFFSATALWYGLSGVGLATLALLFPALAASRHTIITFKRERARTLLRPAWQRYYLDVALLVPALYGWYVLRRQGTLALPGSGLDPFSNPLLFLVPVLFCFSLALVCVRIFPLLMEASAWLAARVPDGIDRLTLPMLITARQLARSTGQYTGPLVLLSLTINLAAFTASMAVTLDNHLRDQVYYQVGADLNLAELGEKVDQPQQPAIPGQPPSPSASAEEEGPRWLFLPVSEHLRIPGIRAAARVGDYTATANIGGRPRAGRLLGIDRADFPAVAFFRRDFAADESLGALMNRLAVGWSNILISRDFLAQNGLAVGDPMRLTVDVGGESKEIDFIVAGALDLFPTHYPQDGPLFVANLEYLYEGLGNTFPYNVWLATDPAVSGEVIVAGVRNLGLNVVTASDAREIIAAEQTRPERQGLFGLLSVGFLTSAMLTVLGFVVYAVASFQRRFVELGMLRAVGLSVRQMAAHLIGEQAVVILTGVGIGTGLGVWASRLFVPYFQVGTDKSAQVPPFVVQVAWERLWLIYAVFGVMFIVAVTGLIRLLVRMRVFEAVKLGETV